MKPLIKWIDGKYLKEELPRREGHFIQVVRKGDVDICNKRLSQDTLRGFL